MTSIALRIEGNLTAIEAGRFEKALSELPLQPGDRLTLDLSHVSYIDSSGLGVLVATMKRLAEQGGGITLRGLQPRVRAVLDVTRMSQIFKIADEDAPDDDPPAVWAAGFSSK